MTDTAWYDTQDQILPSDVTLIEVHKRQAHTFDQNAPTEFNGHFLKVPNKKVSLKKWRGNFIIIFSLQRISSILYVLKLDGSFFEQSYY